MLPDTGETLEYEVQCPLCGKLNTLTLNRYSYRRWKAGQSYVQNIFPDLTAGQREMLLSGICPECWEKTFKEEEDE